MGYRLPFFPMYAAEMLADGRFQGWSLDERGAWVTLLAYAWNDGSIPASHSALARLLHVGPGDMARIWSAIGDRFSPDPADPSRLVSPRLEEERDHAEQINRIRSGAGKKGAEARWNKGKKPDGKRIRLPKAPHGVANGKAVANGCPPTITPTITPTPTITSQPPNPPRLAGWREGDEGSGSDLLVFRSALGDRIGLGRAVSVGGDPDSVVAFFRRQLAAVGEDCLLTDCEALARKSETGVPTTLAWFVGWLERLPLAKPGATA